MDDEKTLLNATNELVKKVQTAINDLAISCESFSILYDRYTKNEIEDADILKEKLRDIIVQVINDEIR